MINPVNTVPTVTAPKVLPSAGTPTPPVANEELPKETNLKGADALAAYNKASISKPEEQKPTEEAEKNKSEEAKENSPSLVKSDSTEDKKEPSTDGKEDKKD